jgi:Ca2+-binding RTX toxin-like protein
VSIARAASLPAGGLTEGDAGIVNHAFTVSLSRAVQVDTTVSWTVSGDPADFQNGALPTGTLTIRAGQTTGTVMVPVRGDLVDELNDTFQVTLSNPIGVAVLGTSTATSTILNDDKVVSIAGPVAGVAEGNAGTSAHTFTVSLSSAATVATTVAWAVTGSGVDQANAEDFGVALPSGTVTFAVGETTKTFTVDVAGDLAFEGNETFTVSLGATPGLRLGTASATSTIVNDDATPTFSIALAEALPAAGLLEGDVGNVNHAFTVSLLGGARQFNTAVNWAVTGTGVTPASATDFANGLLPTGILTFAPGETTKTILVPVRGDLVDEADAGFQVTLSNPTRGAVLVDATATSTILNDDKVISITGPVAAIEEGFAGTREHIFTVNLSSAAVGDTTVAWTVAGSGANQANAADFGGTLPSGFVTILDGQSSATVRVNVAGDPVAEANESFSVTLSNPPVGTRLGTASATSTILNDDASQTPVTPSIVMNGTAKANVLIGTDASEAINGLGGKDTLTGNGGSDKLDGGTGNDTLNGGAGDDWMNGGTGNDILNGGDGNDTLNGGTGVDVLNGENGNDFLIGTAGRDIMTGGAGNDIFSFSANIAEIGKATATRDQIVDFTSGEDYIDLSAIDASSAAGVQDFTFIGSAAFTGLGQLRYENGQLHGNVNGTNAADFTITLVNAPVSLSSGDFIL